MNRGGVGARSLNIEPQKALNPAGEKKIERFGWTFAPGDKVMQIENDYDKANDAPAQRRLDRWTGNLGHRTRGSKGRDQLQRRLGHLRRLDCLDLGKIAGKGPEVIGDKLGKAPRGTNPCKRAVCGNKASSRSRPIRICANAPLLQ
jgi:hypothetical protein